MNQVVKISILMLALFVSSIASLRAQVAEPEKGKELAPTEQWEKMTPEEYICKWRTTAVDNMEIYGIPASITMAQAILESGFGNGYLARVANNHFCIKCKKSWTGKTIIHSDDNPDDCFRVYDTVEASFEDHAEFLSEGKRYEFLFAYDIDDYKSWAKGLKTAGYATAPDYAERLISLIERYNLGLLDQKNGLVKYDEYMAKEFAALVASPVDGPNSEEVAETEIVQTAVKDATKAYADRGIDPNNFRVTINSHKGYNVYLTNGAHYVVAKEGDNYERLGELFDIAPATLRKFNDVSKGVEPNEGDVVYIERKASRWSGSDMLHRVVEGETLYQLSQLYGIRLQQLAKLNRIHPEDALVVGQSLRLR